jgi:hypothetical protein
LYKLFVSSIFLVAFSGLVSAQDTLYNISFSKGLQGGAFKQFKYQLKDYLAGGGRTALTGGWLLVTGYDCFDAPIYGNNGASNRDPEGYNLVSRSAGVFYKAPDGDYTIETCYRQSTWTCNHHGGSRGFMLRSDTNSLDSRAATWIMVGIPPDIAHITTISKADPKAGSYVFGPSDAGHFFAMPKDSSGRVFLKVEKKISTYTFSCRADTASAWTIINKVNGQYGWIGLCDIDCEGAVDGNNRVETVNDYTAYDYLVVTTPGTAVLLPSQKPSPGNRVFLRYINGSVSVNVPSSQTITIGIFDLDGTRIATIDNAKSGLYPVLPDGAAAKTYIASFSNAGTNYTQRFTVVR